MITTVWNPIRKEPKKIVFFSLACFLADCRWQTAALKGFCYKEEILNVLELCGVSHTPGQSVFSIAEEKTYSFSRGICQEKMLPIFLILLCSCDGSQGGPEKKDTQS